MEAWRWYVPSRMCGGRSSESGQCSYQAGGSCGGRTGEGGQGSYQAGGSYGGRSGGDGTGHGHGGSARGGRGARGSEHEQANGFWGGLRRRLKKTLDERDLLENLEELHYQVEAKMIDQAVSVKAKMIGVKDRLKERLSPQKETSLW
uniref:Uncharacterized protein n=1 Tax=Aegilops tauschii TaxID=37682 RepID=N1QXM1_AEGTA